MQNPFDPGYYYSEELRAFGFKSVGENVSIAKTCKIVGFDNIEIGDHSRIDDFCTIIATGSLAVGRRVHIHSYCQIGARGGVTMEDFSSLASGCLLFSASDDASGDYMVGGCVPDHCTRPTVAPVRIGRHAGAFARCTILPGVTMEEGAIACAHALVTRPVEAWTIVAGAPARPRLARSRRLLDFEALAETVREIAA